MAERKPKETGADWVESIALKSKRSADEVGRTLERYNIKPRTEIAIPHRLTIRSVVFTGQKSVVGAQTPIDFEWTDLGPGLHAIAASTCLGGRSPPPIPRPNLPAGIARPKLAGRITNSSSFRPQPESRHIGVLVKAERLVRTDGEPHKAQFAN